ncbi:MAG: 1-acyl-sn-glycerol-3-phosphate acyltransferase [Clostridia bacterium]|nr:1-acyl-sn-glycerol-3-phosphate acyltransferase [Clostridia bacterium]
MAKKKNFYEKAHALLARAVLRLFRIRVIGRENLPTEGGYLYCANHLGLLDPVMIAASAITQVHYMAKKELFRIPLLASLIRTLGAYPVDRGTGDVGAVRRSIELLKDKKSIGIFIQGHRYAGVDLRETKPKHGAALIAMRADAPVIPVCIKMKKNRYALFRPIYVIFGEPIMPAALATDAAGSSGFAQAAQMIFAEICRLGDTCDV